MVSVALDTNTLSYFMRGEGRVAERLRAISPQQVALPAIVVYEVTFGLHRAGRQVQLAAFASMVQATTVLDFDAEAADHAARIRAELEAAGTPIGPHDLLIAATARRYHRVLVTHNTREFSRVPELALDDWFD
jgi:tRNA(fMet)-specific endonuclease VapC